MTDERSLLSHAAHIQQALALTTVLHAVHVEQAYVLRMLFHAVHVEQAYVLSSACTNCQIQEVLGLPNSNIWKSRLSNCFSHFQTFNLHVLKNSFME